VVIGLAITVSCKQDGGGGSTEKAVGSAGAGTAAGSGDRSGTGTGTGSGSDMPDMELTASAQAVVTAFGGEAKVPALPLLAKDGATAAIDVSDGPDLADFASYEVGFLGGDGKLEKVTVMSLDEALALEGADDATAKPDAAKLAANAAALSKRLADGGYTAFGAELVPDGDKPYDLGTAKLEVTEPAEDDSPDLPGSGDVTLRLVDGKGKQIKKEIVKAIAPKKDSDLDCGAEPRLGAVWHDAARKKVLIVVGFMTGGDMCKEHPPTYRLWAVP
jgi:hypothetical protein